GKYLEAAKKFRLAAISSPDNAGPYFALGQALIAMGSYEYAARVIRKAVQLNPDLVREPGDIVGVYPSQDEFDRVMAELEKAAKKSVDARFLVGVQRYFSGDPRARQAFAALAKELPEDELVKAFRDAVEKRFKAEGELPPVQAPEKTPK
ncbi:MAG: tetratricopeptide repeat protein, partial [Planctomycetota bacterium]